MRVKKVTTLAGMLLLFTMSSPTSALAQRTVETIDSASDELAKESRRTPEASPKASKAAQGASHVPATTIKNASGNLLFEVGEGGSLLVPGQDGAVPAEGPGARIMWSPSLRAFRAGEVGVNTDGTEWDGINTGTWSVALGVDTKASGNYGSVALGEGTEATGLTATAMGGGTDATADYATAMNVNTIASGRAAMAMGSITEASGHSATAMGAGTEARAYNSVAMGEYTEASDSNAVAMGLATEASDSNAVAMGTLSKARAANSVAAGFDVLAETRHSLAAGRCNQTSTNALFVVGNGPLNSTGDACINGGWSDALVLTESGDMTIAGSLTENSDRRLKTDIEPIDEEVLDALQNIDPVRFRFKNEQTHPSGRQIGLIAQDVQKKFPELVNRDSNGYLSLSYTKFSALLLKGIQEQRRHLKEKTKRIADLNAKVEAMSNQQNEIKRRLEALETRTENNWMPAGWAGSGTLVILLALGIGFGIGLLWRGRSGVQEISSL